MDKKRIETDTLGEIDVPANCYWGAQTERALRHFAGGVEIVPQCIIHALAIIKKAAAYTNHELGKLSAEKMGLIVAAAEEVLAGKYDDQFPLTIWQSGSGTQTNMNVNEVIANCAIVLAGGVLGNKKLIHPNDDVNMSQSTNDVFPSAMHIAATKLIMEKLLPAVCFLRTRLREKQENFKSINKIGRTHLQDAVPLKLGEEFSGYVAQLDICISNLHSVLPRLQELPLGGTAVGNCVNAPPQFAKRAIEHISKITGITFVPVLNKFAALAAHEAIIIASGALKSLAAAIFKIANDIRWLASGPRCGIGELILPGNEPGSSIMPGKINPTQAEAIMMMCAQVYGNDAAIGFAAAQGNFELNVFKPVIIYNFLQSIHLLAAGCANFAEHAIHGLTANKQRIDELLNNSLMLVTWLTPILGYDKAAKIAQVANAENSSLREACIKLGYLTGEEFDAEMHRHLHNT